MSAIREDIKKAYTDAVQSGNSTGKVYITDMMDENYSDKGAETEEVQSFGCGDPVRAALLKEGERVLDLGCGAGFDLILASKKVGEKGHIYGLDMTDAMVEKARKNMAKLNISNVTVLQGYIEEIPVSDAGVDVLISNCVINLSPEKEKVFAEAYRVLADNGRFCVSDVVLMKKVPEKLKSSPAAWSGWVAGALPAEEYKKKLEEAGFKNVTVSITKPHEINVEVLKSTVMDLTEADLKEIEGVSASALITAIKKAN